MINQTIIEKAQKEICDAIDLQVRSGNQSSQNLPDNVFSCGQFLIIDRPQRGLHGHTAAMHILIRSNEDNSNKVLIDGLLNYLDSYTEHEDKTKIDRIDLGFDNVIKVSELLYSLSFLSQGTANASKIINDLSSKLKAGLRNDQGWGFFFSDETGIDVLPTSYAFMALKSLDYLSADESKSITKYIQSQLDEMLKNSDFNPTVHAKAVLALYSLVYSNKKSPKKSFIRYFLSLWKKSSFTEPVEQNLEYWKGSYHDYIRVPWQLYLYSIAVKISWWHFAKVLTIKSFRNMIFRTSEGDLFKYPYSGPDVSTRTQAILYDTLEHISEYMKKQIVYLPMMFAHKVLKLFKSRFVRTAIYIFFIAFTCYVIYGWYKNPEMALDDLGPELLSSILFWLYAFSRSRIIA